MPLSPALLSKVPLCPRDANVSSGRGSPHYSALSHMLCALCTAANQSVNLPSHVSHENEQLPCLKSSHEITLYRLQLPYRLRRRFTAVRSNEAESAKAHCLESDFNLRKREEALLLDARLMVLRSALLCKPRCDHGGSPMSLPVETPLAMTAARACASPNPRLTP